MNLNYKSPENEIKFKRYQTQIYDIHSFFSSESSSSSLACQVNINENVFVDKIMRLCEVLKQQVSSEPMCEGGVNSEFFHCFTSLGNNFKILQNHDPNTINNIFSIIDSVLNNIKPSYKLPDLVFEIMPQILYPKIMDSFLQFLLNAFECSFEFASKVIQNNEYFIYNILEIMADPVQSLEKNKELFDVELNENDEQFYSEYKKIDQTTIVNIRINVCKIVYLFLSTIQMKEVEEGNKKIRLCGDNFFLKIVIGTIQIIRNIYSGSNSLTSTLAILCMHADIYSSEYINTIGCGSDYGYNNNSESNENSETTLLTVITRELLSIASDRSCSGINFAFLTLVKLMSNHLCLVEYSSDCFSKIFNVFVDNPFFSENFSGVGEENAPFMSNATAVMHLIHCSFITKNVELIRELTMALTSQFMANLALCNNLDERDYFCRMCHDILFWDEFGTIQLFDRLLVFPLLLDMTAQSEYSIKFIAMSAITDNFDKFDKDLIHKLINYNFISYFSPFVNSGNKYLIEMINVVEILLDIIDTLSKEEALQIFRALDNDNVFVNIDEFKNNPSDVEEKENATELAENVINRAKDIRSKLYE